MSKSKLKSPPKTVVGIIHVHARGFGFVSPIDKKESGCPEDIFIPKHLKSNAVDGDKVRVSLHRKKYSNKGPEGSVVEIIERTKSFFVGTVWMINPKGHYLLHVPSLGMGKLALVYRGEGSQYRTGDRLLLLAQDWGDEKDPVICEVQSQCGSLDQPSTDVTSAIHDFQLCETFPKEVLEEAQNFSQSSLIEETKRRTDLTHLTCFTIDPSGAQDFDDALSITHDADGLCQLGVHIADVSHYVVPNSPLDVEAKKRANSVYFPGQCLPMLPEVLSNDLCSLRENVTRLTISVLFSFDSQGNVLQSSIVRSFIRSRKRMDYQEARQIVEGTLESPYQSSLHQMAALCHLLKRKRMKRGSIDLAIPECTLLLDDQKQPYDYVIQEYDIAHQLVEEFMLKANEIVAQYFVEKNLPSVFRIHNIPLQENLENFYEFARSLGFNMPKAPTTKDVQSLFQLAKKTEHSYHLSVAFIRSMQLAIYSKENVGHYGLALENYCHFTSPIRRYSDLIVHRLLFSEGGQSDLEEIAQHCSAQERRAFKAEMSVILLKKLRLLSRYFEQDPHKVYHAVVTKVKPFGVIFEVIPFALEGTVALESLPQGHYEYQATKQRLIDRNNRRSWRIGDQLKVQLLQIDLILMKNQWKILSKNSLSPPKRPRGKGRKRKKA